MSALLTIGNDLMRQCLAYPDAVEEAPWGHQVAKVRKKMFVIFDIQSTKLGLSVKLPFSSEEARSHDWVAPTGYGMGKSGWCSMTFTHATEVPVELVLDWIDESYRAIAPKTLTRDLADGSPPIPPPEVIPDVPQGAPRVLLVGDDHLRLGRGSRELAKRGIEGLEATITSETLDIAGQGSPSAILVDLSKSALVAQGIAAELADICWDVPMLVAGIRDKKMELKVAAALPKAEFSRNAPGDTKVVNRLILLAGA